MKGTIVLSIFHRGIFLLFISIFLFACGDSDNQGLEQEPNPLLINCWMHVPEEQSDEEIKFYRVCDNEWMAANILRYRDVFSLEEDNVYTYSVLARNDAHFKQQGHWTYDEENAIITLTNAEGNTFQIEIIELEEDVLRFIIID